MRQIVLIAGLIEFSLAAGCLHGGFKVIPLGNAQQEVSEDEIRHAFSDVSVEWTRIPTCAEEGELFDQGQLFLFAPNRHISGQTTVISVRCWANADRQSDHAHCKMWRPSISLFRYRGRFLGYSGPIDPVGLPGFLEQFESSATDRLDFQNADLTYVLASDNEVDFNFSQCGCVGTIRAERDPQDSGKLIFPDEMIDRGCY